MLKIKKLLKISKIDFSIILYFIIVLIPIEIRLFNAGGTAVMVNFKPVLLLPLVYLLLNTKIFFKNFIRENRSLIKVYFLIILYLIFNCFYNGLVNKIPLILAKYFIYIFNFYFVWYILKTCKLMKFINYLFYISFFFTLYYILNEFSKNNFVGFKDTYWYIILSITSLVYIRKFRYLLYSLIFVEILSLSRTGWIAVVLIYIRKISFRKIFYYLFSLTIVSIIFSNLNIPQLNKYFETFSIISQNFNELLSISFSDFTDKSLFSNPSDNHRIFEIYRSLDIISNNFIFGIGFENYFNFSTSNYDAFGGIVRLPHNEFLRLFTEGGIILVSLSMYLYYLVYKQSQLSDQDNPFLYSSLGLFFFTSSNFITFFLFLISYFISKNEK